MTDFVREDRDYAGKIPEALKLLDPDRAVADYLRTIHATKGDRAATMSLSS
jgi:hypothetical protein